MTNAHLMDILDASDKFLEVLAGHVFRQASVGGDDVKKFATLDVFHNQVKALVRLNDLIHLTHVWVMELLQNFDFSHHSLNVLLVFHLLFFKDFDSDLELISESESTYMFTCNGVCSQFDQPKSALAQCFT